MKKLVVALVGAGALAVLGGPAAAGPDFPWCVGKANGEYMDCSYSTLRQCVETARGVGHCSRNGRFDNEYYWRGQVAPTDIDPNGRPLRSRHRR